MLSEYNIVHYAYQNLIKTIKMFQAPLFYNV